MDTLTKISNIFERIKDTVKNKKTCNRLQNLKRDILLLQSELVVYGKENNVSYIRTLAMEGYLALLSAKTMPLSLIEKKDILTVAFDKLKQYAFREECLFIFLRVQNLLCYFHIQLDEVNQAKDILENMEEMYDKISKSKTDMYIDAEDLFVPDPVTNIKRMNPEKIDKLITNNVQMLAFLYNKLDMPEKYTLYSHTALRRQLEMKEGTPQDWALRTARLGNYFTYLNQLGNARHHLCAAYHILRTCHDNCKLMPEEFVHQKADFEMNFLELSHHWVKYGLTLFQISRKKILNRFFSRPESAGSGVDLWKTADLVQESFDDSETHKENNKDSGPEKYDKGDCLTDKICIFPSLDLAELEKKVPVEIVRNAEEARNLFSFTHKWLKRAEHYYDFEHHSAQYISCSLQLAELYEHLAFFEKDIDRQYNIQKRRADVLETLNSLLKNVDNIMSIQIDVIKELSQVQLELMALNLQKLWREESQTNIFNLDNDADSIINNSLHSESNKTLTEKTLNTSSRNVFLCKMKAATSINGKLFRLSGQLGPRTPSELSFDYELLKN